MRFQEGEFWAQGETHTTKPPVAGVSADVLSLGIFRLFVGYRYFCIKLAPTQFVTDCLTV